MSQLMTWKELEVRTVIDLEHRLAVYETMHQAQAAAAKYKYGKGQHNRKYTLIANS